MRRACPVASHVPIPQVALHWAVGQIALGPVDSIPQNTLERIFCVLATMIGFLFGSTLVSSLSAAMIDYQMSRSFCDFRQ